MKDIITGLLKPEKITAVVSSNTISYRDLHHIDLRYVKAGKFYRAQAFYTEMWVAKTPVGPVIAHDGNIIMDTLADVATIEEYSDASELKQVSEMQEHHLQEIYKYLDGYATLFASKHLGEFRPLLYRAHFTFTPVPQVIVTLAQDGEFQGSVAIAMNGEVRLLTRTNFSVDILVEELRRKCDNTVYKEFAYGY